MARLLTPHETQAVGWLPPFEEPPAQQHFHVKATRSIKRAMDKVRARRAEDRHLMELAEYHHPFLEA